MIEDQQRERADAQPVQSVMSCHDSNPLADRPGMASGYRDGASPRAPGGGIGTGMSLRPWRDIARRQSRQIMVGNVPVGGDAPVTVQTMTNTPTSDAKATIDQIRRCEDAGVDIIRVSCPDVESTAALKQIVRASRVPIVADIHFHYKRALEAADAGAACLRINPGQYRIVRARERSRQRGQGQWLRDPHRRQCRQPREGSARKIWRAVPRGAGRKRARSYQAAAGPRLPRIQGRGEGERPVPRGRRLSAARRRGRLPAASRHHRGGRVRRRHGQVLDRDRAACSGTGSATRSASRSRPSPRRKCASASRS